MRARDPIVAAITMALVSCQTMRNLHPDVHGHRGCRGHLPENSIPGFLRALELGCDFLELDVVISGDGQVIVSHEPWMSETICTDVLGDSLDHDAARRLNLYHMSAEEIRRHDCGSRGQERFPEQRLMPVHKPTLREVVEAADEHALLNGFASPSYNIEIKSDPAWYGIMQPRPEPYADLVIATIDDLGIASRCLVQSFDPAILEAVHAQRSDIPLAFLVENKESLKKNLERLSFQPDVYSPWYGTVTQKMLEKLREKGIELVVWTVNEPKDIRRMLELGVDGIISDYPDRVVRELERQD